MGPQTDGALGAERPQRWPRIGGHVGHRWRRLRHVAGAVAGVSVHLAIVTGIAATIGVAARPAAAQRSPGFQVRIDNDGFNFRQHPARRSDGEYTNGVRMSFELGRTPFWRQLVPNAPPCATVAESALRCSSLVLSAGQEIYTPAEDSQPRTYPGWRRQRPYGGWLYGAMAMRVVRRSTIRSAGIALGVTGPPSLASRAQRKAHEMMSGFTAIPMGWDTQVRFEPGVIASAYQRWLLFSGRVGGMRFLDGVVGAGGSVGNIDTHAQVSADLRAGLNLSHPWRRAEHRGPLELVGTIGVRGRAVARNIFLDGNTVNPDRRVERIPGVADIHGSVGIRIGALVLAYAMTERSREYTTGPAWHRYGTVLLGIGGIPDAAR